MRQLSPNYGRLAYLIETGTIDPNRTLTLSFGAGGLCLFLVHSCYCLRAGAHGILEKSRRTIDS